MKLIWPDEKLVEFFGSNADRLLLRPWQQIDPSRHTNVGLIAFPNQGEFPLKE